MMQIQSLDQDRRLWSVSELLPHNLVEEILAFDWLNAKYESGNLDNRRQIHITEQVEDFDKAILSLLPDINEQLGTNFKNIFGQWWLDLEGFYCGMHTDGHLSNSMQIYWIAPGLEYGTGFYHYKQEDKLKHQFLSLTNSGYIMLNHLNPDGSQPLQWHAMLNQLKPGMVRLSSYHIFDL